MELRHLRYFVAVAEEQNVTRAAARLHVSQPPLTRQIHDLEAELGVALFQRTGRTIRLSDAGRLFLGEAQAVLRHLEDAVTRVQAAAATGELHVGYAPTPTVELLPKLLRELERRAPGGRILLHDCSSPEMLSGLREGRLQAALLLQPPKPAAKGIAFEPLQSFPLGVAVSPRHPFARRKSVTRSEVLREPLVAYARREYPDYHALIASRVGAAFRRVRFAEECDGGPSLIAAVASGRGICVIPSFITAAAGDRLKFIPLAPAPAPAIVGLAHRKGFGSPLFQSFQQCARALAL